MSTLVHVAVTCDVTILVTFNSSLAASHCAVTIIALGIEDTCKYRSEFVQDAVTSRRFSREFTVKSALLVDQVATTIASFLSATIVSTFFAIYTSSPFKVMPPVIISPSEDIVIPLVLATPVSNTVRPPVA